MIIKGFECSNDEKLERAINGSMSSRGQLANGVGKDASDEAKLAAYDRLGGLITKDGRKVKNGSFWDIKNNCPKEEPVVIYEVTDLEGNWVEISEDELTPEILAAEKIAKKKKTTKKSKK